MARWNADVAIGLAIAGIDDVDLIDKSVAIPVVVGIVDVGIGQLASLDDHFGRPQVVALSVVAAVVGLGVGNGVGAYDIEGEVEHALALSIEVIMDGSDEAVFLEVLLVGDAVEEVWRVGRAEGHVGVVDEDDEPFLGTGVVAILADSLRLLKSGGTTGVGPLATGVGALGNGFGIDLGEEVGIGQLLIGSAIGGEPVVAMLVANELCGDSGAISEGQGACESAFGRNGTGSESHDGE